LSQSQSHIATDGQSISKSWFRDPCGVDGQIFIALWQLRSWFYGASSLTRGRVCLLHMLLALASVVFLGSDSVGTRDRILLSQISDFLFVVSYDSQGHGGGILSRLHTGNCYWITTRFVIQPPYWLHRKYNLYCWQNLFTAHYLTMGNVFTSALRSKEHGTTRHGTENHLFSCLETLWTNPLQYYTLLISAIVSAEFRFKLFH
jgi:hypothetical protein